MSKKFISVVLVFAMLFAFAACGEEKKQGEEENPEQQPVEEHFYNRFTGEEVTKEESLKRGYAVMINNHKAAQPLLGITQADMIYEMMVEGGITRFMAIYSDPSGIPQLGSVRSIRKCYLDMVSGIDTFIVHAGQSPEAFEIFKSGAYDHVNGENVKDSDYIFWRDAERKKTKALEHTLVTSGDKITAYFNNGTFRTSTNGPVKVFNFGETSSAAKGTAANKVTVKFSAYKTGVFDYNAETKMYEVSQFGKPIVDGNNDKTLAVKNVFVMITDTVPTHDEKNHIDVVTTGSGNGYYISEGKAIAVKWSRANIEDPVIYTDPVGNEITVLPGVSYVNWIGKTNTDCIIE